MTDRAASTGFLVGGETVQTYNDEHYKKLRERWGLGDDFLENFDFSKNMKGGGGKGGDLMGVHGINYCEGGQSGRSEESVEDYGGLRPAFVGSPPLVASEVLFTFLAEGQGLR